MKLININKSFDVFCEDGAKGMSMLPDHSIKLIYGSPPYPNADRNYGIWSSSEYISFMEPFIDAAKKKLTPDGFFIINVKANRETQKRNQNTTRSLVVEKLAVLLEEKWGFSCVDIEIWAKDNPISTGLRCACQDAYEQILWFANSNPWKINLDAIRRPYSESTLKKYANNEFKPRTNGLGYVTKVKTIDPHPLGALPINIIKGSVMWGKSNHQARQPGYVPNKYILATTNPNDLVVDPWVGTGTTGIEALRLGRRFIGFDIHNEFVEITKNQLDTIISEEVYNYNLFETSSAE